MKAEITKDKDLAIYVFNELKEFVGGENAPNFDEVDWDAHFEKDLFVAIYSAGELAGLVCFYEIGDGIWDGHMNMLYGHRGSEAQWAYDEAIKILKIEKSPVKAVAEIDDKFPNVQGFVERQGWALAKHENNIKHYELELQ